MTVTLEYGSWILNLDYENSKTKSTIYGAMPLIKKATTNSPLVDDSFDLNGVPLPYFFNERSKFLAELARKIVCNTTKFIDDSGNY